MEGLSLKKLLETGEEIVRDPQIGFAAEIDKLVQDITIDGKEYEVRLVLKLKE